MYSHVTCAKKLTFPPNLEPPNYKVVKALNSYTAKLRFKTKIALKLKNKC